VISAQRGNDVRLKALTHDLGDALGGEVDRARRVPGPSRKSERMRARRTPADDT